MKKAPLLISIFISAVLFSIFGFAGKDDIYYYQDFKLLKNPYFTGMFIGMSNDYYPWMLYDDSVRTVEKQKVDAIKEKKNQMLLAQKLKEQEALEEENASVQEDTDNLDVAKVESTPTPKPTPTPTPEPTYTPRYAPLRDSTYEEYAAHISADIYGDEGENFALSYDDYISVDESYFDNALFIGDSRTVGLREYTDLSEHADFLAETSLTIWRTLKSDFGGKGKLEDILSKKKYDQIYIMVGVNELGTGTTEDYMSEYTNVVDTISKLQPEAIIYIQAIMNVDKEKSLNDTVFNNVNIMGRNHAIATLADNERIFYININEAVCDEEGYLRDDLRGDHLHLKATSNKLWKKYLMKHAIVDPKDRAKYKDVVIEDEAKENIELTPSPSPQKTVEASKEPEATATPNTEPEPTQETVEESDAQEVEIVE